MSPARQADKQLDALIDEIAVDAYDEDEQLMRFEAAFDEDATFPCPGTVFGEQVQVLHVDLANNRRELIATANATGAVTRSRCSTSTSTQTLAPHD